MTTGVPYIETPSELVTPKDPPLKTVDRALTVLLAFGGRQTGWNLSELSRQLGWQKAVTHRILVTLARRGFLTIDQETKEYRLGPTILSLGMAAERSGLFESQLLPVLHDLVSRANESAIFVIPEGNTTRCIASVRARTALTYDVEPGKRFPGHAGAASRAVFAYYKPDIVDHIFRDPLPRFSDTTITDLTELKSSFQKAVEMGYTVSRSEFEPGVMALAVPVLRSPDQVFGALCVAGSTERIDPHVTTLLTLLRQAAVEIEAAIIGRRTTELVSTQPFASSPAMAIPEEGRPTSP